MFGVGLLFVQTFCKDTKSWKILSLIYTTSCEAMHEEGNRRTVKHNLITCSMVQSPSWEANWFEASQEIPRISRNPKVHYRTHKRPSPVSILGQPNSVHIPTSHLLEIHPNIIHPSTPRSPQWPPRRRWVKHNTNLKLFKIKYLTYFGLD